MVNKKESTVKIDFELAREVEEFINKKENKLRYVSKKQFIDIAVAELLKKVSTNVDSKSLTAKEKKR